MSDLYTLQEDSWARRLVYLVAFLLIVIPFVQAGSQVWPLQLSNITWRFGAANAFSSVLLLPFLGLGTLLYLARATESRGLSMLVGVLSTIFSVALLGSLVLFALDALQLKPVVSTQMENAFRTTSFRVFVVTLIFVVSFPVLAMAGFRTPRPNSPAPARRSEKKTDAPGLIVGREYAANNE
jgi:hypothetical protein